MGTMGRGRSSSTRAYEACRPQNCGEEPGMEIELGVGPHTAAILKLRQNLEVVKIATEERVQGLGFGGL